MYFSTAVIAAFALTTSAAPLVARGNTCGSAPTGSSSNNQPLLQPTGTQTAADCQTQCEANSSCKSFCFGLVDNTIQCKLYSVAAASVPKQSSTNLVVYDKACSAVPSVVPTSSNPTGKKTDNQQSEGNSKSGSKTTEQPAAESKQAAEPKKVDDSKKTDDTKETTKESTYNQKQTTSGNTQKQSSSTNTQKQSSSTNTQKQSSSANTCGTKPSASTNNQPISTPSVTSEDACKAKCQANSSCKSFTCGKVNNSMVCKLYSVSAAQVPAPTNSAQKTALKAYDVGCSI